MTIFKSPLADVALRDISITDRLFEGLDGDPDRVVLIDGPSGATMTGATLRDRIQRLAAGLTTRGFGAGQVVAILAPNMPDYATVFHGVAYAGGTITTINPTYTASEVRHQLKDAGASLVVTIPAFLQTLQEAIADLPQVQGVITIGQVSSHASIDDWMADMPQAAQVPVDLDRHILVLPYSSGTTGLPKGVMLSHRNLVVNVEQAIICVDMRRADTSIAFLPFFHIYGMTALMNAFLSTGGCLVTMPRFDLEGVLTHIQTHKVRLMMVAPPVAIALTKHPLVDQFDLSSLQVLFSAAAPLGPEVSQACSLRLNCVIVQGYGMTELSPLSHAVPHRAPKLGSVGPTVPNSQTRIVDPVSGTNQGPGQEGEVWVRGPQVMLGYLNNPEATAKTMDGDWLKTGDLGMMDEDGYLFIRDRLKELIKVKGFQVAPAEVEGELLGLPGVADAAVIGVPDDEAGEVPMAFVVSTAGASQDVATIQAALRKRLASYKVPTRIEFIDAIPKSAAGKILRRVLRDRVKNQS
jgi:acyl-CoA synthetase (AMP-forming)/AMP-acid ligase II